MNSPRRPARLEDVQALDLDAEGAYDRGSAWSIKQNLRKNGANEQEVEFLLDQRVELNALASDDLVEWVESKLDEHGIAKVVPDEATLVKAYRHNLASNFAEQDAAEIIEKAKGRAHDSEIPVDLKERIADRLEADRALSWDDAVAEIVAEEIEGDQ